MRVCSRFSLLLLGVFSMVAAPIANKMFDCGLIPKR